MKCVKGAIDLVMFFVTHERRFGFRPARKVSHSTFFQQPSMIRIDGRDYVACRAVVASGV
jgi:hypothetical protein